MPEVRLFEPATALHGNGVALVSDTAGQIHADGPYGLFAGDTRVLSSYRFEVNGCQWELLGRACHGHGSAQWHFQNRSLRDASGEVEAGAVVFTLNRRVDGALHDDLWVTSFARRPLRLRFTVQLDADFGDLFQVKDSTVAARLRTLRLLHEDGFTLRYERDGFVRALHVRIAPRQRFELVGSRLHFDLALEHGRCWRCCLEALPEVDGQTLGMASDPHAPEPDPCGDQGGIELRADAPLAGPFERGRQDLHALALPQAGAPAFVAAGIPWFLTLFGRDSLLPALMAGIDGPWLAEGALAALAAHQAREHDDFRDAQPGKLPHELRRDELTHNGTLPYSPYYGTHDTPSLYCLVLWNAWRWSGDRSLLERHFDTALRALHWCDTLGDCDGDGLQEYRTRSRKGYLNQGWKDAGDAIVDAAGRQARPPLATVELQGYLYATRLAMAELMDTRGEAALAQQQHELARALRRRVEARYWMDRAGFYALALDAAKRPVDAVASNAAHLLWCGLPSDERAARVARRLLAPDLFSGWGLRTLSADNPAYNPVSYQRGSAWPFDTLLAAAGLMRYGLNDAAFTLIRAVLDAAAAFEADRLPELYGGFDRAYGAPVPYRQANIPQAWSAAAPLLAVQLLLGLVPDAPNRRCHVAPSLPPWLPRLAIDKLRVGDGLVRIELRRDGPRTVIERLDGEGVELIVGKPVAPLWGSPA
jgi:glycogen debranching enzyme